MKNKSIGKIIASLAFVACASVAQAATITVNPFSPAVNAGDVFNVSIVGTGFTDGSGGASWWWF